MTESRTWVNDHSSVGHHEPCPRICMNNYPEGKSCSDRRRVFVLDMNPRARSGQGVLHSARLSYQGVRAAAAAAVAVAPRPASRTPPRNPSRRVIENKHSTDIGYGSP